MAHTLQNLTPQEVDRVSFIDPGAPMTLRRGHDSSGDDRPMRDLLAECLRLRAARDAATDAFNEQQNGFAKTEDDLRYLRRRVDDLEDQLETLGQHPRDTV